MKKRGEFEIDLRQASRLRLSIGPASWATGQRWVRVYHGFREAGFYIYRREQVVVDVQPIGPDTCKVVMYSADSEEIIRK